MRIGLRVLLGYFAIVAVAALLLAQVFVQQVKPGVRQAMEDTLADTANLLAELAADDLRDGRMADGAFAAAVARLGERDPAADIWGFRKSTIDYRVMVTDDRGIVVYDSAGIDVGRDNSRWNDVHRTLRGAYGARSTRADPDDEDSSVMHVAAPVRDGQRIAGVLTVAKPNRSIAPFIAASQQVILRWGAVLLGVSLLVGLAASWWLSRQLGALRRYADAVTAGQPAALPRSAGEFADLGRALATMRDRLEGKAYVEDYVHALTHELKSPLTAIRASAELLQDAPGKASLAAADRARLAASIDRQGRRMAEMIDQLLALAGVEHRSGLEAPVAVDLAATLREAIDANAERAAAAGVSVASTLPAAVATVRGDAFLLRQLLVNLLDNAVDFSPRGSTVEVGLVADGDAVLLHVDDRGAGVPDYARDRVFERFYSLARPGGERGSGLGLPFVARVAELHGGDVRLDARDGGGTSARVTLPRAH